MCLMIRISMVPPPPPPSPPLTLFHKMSRIADCQCDISCFFPSLLSFSPCFCFFFFLCVSRLCSKYGLCLSVYVCLYLCVCVSQFVVEIVLLISYECQRWRWRWRCWALLGTRFSFRWKQEWFAPSQKLVRCCDLPSPSSTTLWSPLDRIAVWVWKNHKIFHRQFFKVCVFGISSYLFLKVVSGLVIRKTIWTHKGFWEWRNSRQLKVLIANRHWVVTVPTVGQTNRRRPVISWEKDR